MKDIIQKKLESYGAETVEGELNALKEIIQEVILYALSQTDFFKRAFFQGGTCLRIVHGLDRFSEDLDFALRNSDSKFDIQTYLERVVETMHWYGCNMEISGKDRTDGNIKSRTLKDDNIQKVLTLEHNLNVRKKIKIKVDIDIDPPRYAKFEANYMDFPMDFMIMTHDLTSLFSGKCHALLCRRFSKGRDWYDYLWYIKKNVQINLKMLEDALKQFGPWKNKNIMVTESWLKKELHKKIQTIKWDDIKKDISRFIKSREREGLELWHKEFFIKKTNKIFS